METGGQRSGSQSYGRKVPLTEEERRSLDEPGRSQPMRKRGKARLVIATIAIAIVALVSVWFVYLKAPGENGPEDAVRGIVDAMNRRDGEHFVSHTMLSFDTPGVIATYVNDVEQGWAEDDEPQMKIVSLEVVAKDQLSSEVVERFEHYSTLFETVHHIDVEDFCGVHVAITAASGGGVILEEDLPIYRVDSVWYVDIFFDPWTE